METSPKRPTEAWLDPRLADSGFGYVIVARFKASGDTEAGVFLVDLKCLGVKNAFLSRLTLQEYETRLLGDLRTNTGTFESVSPACARKLVESAIAYARALGLEPHEDYRLAQRVFGGINPAECNSDRGFTFGEQGKPLFIQGPNDSPEFVVRVMAQLERRCGPGGFHYLLSLGEKPSQTDSDLPPEP
jgi:GNAT superfamily N-acetyltransferase